MDSWNEFDMMVEELLEEGASGSEIVRHVKLAIAAHNAEIEGIENVRRGREVLGPWGIQLVELGWVFTPGKRGMFGGLAEWTSPNGIDVRDNAHKIVNALRHNAVWARQMGSRQPAPESVS